ncbi:MAG: hypothetical protein II937_13580 [Bacteroidales bacterium]|nr:hypothetical protein [Bacteroidales bacterium]
METNKTITEDYVSFETAKLLKEKGFNEVCRYEYGVPEVNGGYVLQEFYKPIQNCELIDTAYTAPTLQMAMKWLRKIHNCIIMIDYDSYESADDSSITETGYSFTLQRKEKPTEYEYIHNLVYDTYEEVAEEGIKYCLTKLL